jgi:hypothetical protein
MSASTPGSTVGTGLVVGAAVVAVGCGAVDEVAGIVDVDVDDDVEVADDVSTAGVVLGGVGADRSSFEHAESAARPTTRAIDGSRAADRTAREQPRSGRTTPR